MKYITNNKTGDISLKSVFYVIFFAIILSFVFAKVVPSLSEAAEHSAAYSKCKITVALTSYTKSPVTGKSAFTTNCPRDSITFYDHAVIESVEGKDTKLYVQDPASGYPAKQFSEINDQIVLPVIAKKLKECWDKFEKGKGMPIDQKLFHKRKDNCHICSEIGFSISQEQSFGNLNDYITSHNYAQDFDHENIAAYFDNNLILKSSDITSLASYKLVYLQNIPPKALQVKEYIGLSSEKQKNQIVFGRTEDINCQSYN